MFRMDTSLFLIAHYAPMLAATVCSKLCKYVCACMYMCHYSPPSSLPLSLHLPVPLFPLSLPPPFLLPPSSLSSRPQAITKQFAEILHFTLSFDDLKVIKITWAALEIVTFDLVTSSVVQSTEVPVQPSQLRLACALCLSPDDKPSYSEWL